jgi:membrane peptidoglycan carboxypeptidase
MPEGLHVYTTLNLDLQESAEHLIRQAAVTLTASAAEVQMALLSIDPCSGATRCMVGSRDYASCPFNYTVRSHMLMLIRFVTRWAAV